MPDSSLLARLGRGVQEEMHKQANAARSGQAAFEAPDWSPPPAARPALVQLDRSAHGDKSVSAPAQPLVSIITPVRNGVRYLGDLLESVRRQDYPRLEHIIVDGNSGDGTLNLLRSAPHVVWATRPDSSMYEAINDGIRMARGELIGCLNADDRYVVPGTIAEVVRYFAEHPEVDALYGDFVYIDEAGRRIPRRAPVGREFCVRALKRYNFVPAHSTFVKRRVVVEGRGLWFDPELQFAGDWEWALRLGRAGVRFGHVPKVLSEFRLHSASKTSLLGLRYKVAEWRRVCRRHGARLSVLLLYESFYGPLIRRLGMMP